MQVQKSLIFYTAPLSTARAYRVYVVALIWCVLLLRFVDLQIIAVLLEPIKREFAVSDTQLGLLTGFAFSIFYGALGIPVAYLAERWNRRTLVAIALALWSLATALCGQASSFTNLFAARIGVGIGESGSTAPAYSLISDYVPANRRATVFAFLNCAVPVGVFVGFIVGGYVQAHYGWRAAFMVVGAPGLLVALLVRLTLREPSRGLSEPQAGTAASEPLRSTLRHLLRVPSYRHFVAATSIFTLGAMGSGIWIPSFFIRVHGMQPSTVAISLAWIYGVGGVIGALAGGSLADHLVKRTRDTRWYGLLCGIFSAAILPSAFFVYLWPDRTQAMLCHIATVVLMHAWMGPAYGTIQSLAGVQRRAVAAAVNLLVINLIAYGAGPFLVGAASDYFAARLGNESLRYSILCVVVVAYSWAAVHFFLASRTLRKDLDSALAQGV